MPSGYLKVVALEQLYGEEVGQLVLKSEGVIMSVSTTKINSPGHVIQPFLLVKGTI